MGVLCDESPFRPTPPLIGWGGNWVNRGSRDGWVAGWPGCSVHNKYHYSLLVLMNELAQERGTAFNGPRGRRSSGRSPSPQKVGFVCTLCPLPFALCLCTWSGLEFPLNHLLNLFRVGPVHSHEVPSHSRSIRAILAVETPNGSHRGQVIGSGRFLGVFGWDPSVCKSNRLHVDVLRFFLFSFFFLYGIRVCSINCSTTVGDFSCSLELRPIISQTRPV